MKSVLYLRRDHSWIVEMESAYCDAVVLQNAVVGYVYGVHCERQAFAEAVAEG